MGDAERRRRRLRHHGEVESGSPAPDGPSVTTAPVHDEAARSRRAGLPADEGERGLRGLVGSGSSQVGVTAALRARDAARPTDADLAEAEARVVIVRRNWVPREDLPRSGR
ncbi:hypothetical protein [Micromonospora sp. RTP1Z1]|uniref:hypothetical protein n=1 Tax=Micromonospora sp. RTP1Z1 TaxID=2994043 RepID=UPI0029C980D4|nr:hypothetical protein [Micromonospora sp. RTP1Z1]